MTLLDPLAQWEQAHPAAARALWSLLTPTSPAPHGAGSEARVQRAVRLEAARKGYMMHRNNVGVLRNDAGVPIRFGLANDSSAMNRVMKSADLIGIGPNGQFVSVEVKRPGGVIHPAQHSWAALVNKRGGLGLIVDREGMLP